MRFFRAIFEARPIGRSKRGAPMQVEAIHASAQPACALDALTIVAAYFVSSASPSPTEWPPATVTSQVLIARS